VRKDSGAEWNGFLELDFDCWSLSGISLLLFDTKPRCH
jgi:hypothetical protein